MSQVSRKECSCGATCPTIIDGECNRCRMIICPEGCTEFNECWADEISDQADPDLWDHEDYGEIYERDSEW